MTIKLSIELVPSSSWFNNVRSAVTKKRWDYIRARVCSLAYDTCEICGDIGPKHPVECHEIWSFNNKESIRKLEGMIALCPNCHMVKHFGLAEVQGKRGWALYHFMKVNGLTRNKAEAYIKQAFEVWEKRSTKEWTVDISHLSTYGIDITKLRKHG